ncbi:hypothetical protein VaNZ11_000330 [Volvox africanus]|uniref:Major facilitator superfamily (MFS) profile domain-containing protein n=1 Tax=Volvox africanus TaxID=51714 RepID=A0ABQ5RLW4_9CHLO|nr:hypothetical protein VaNZ11_000330 [Volvox africanus]
MPTSTVGQSDMVKVPAERRAFGCGLVVNTIKGGVESPHHCSMTFRRRVLNIVGLSMGWCLMVSVMFIQLSTTTLAARDYSGSATATLPAGVMMAAATVSMTPGALLMKSFGRKPVLFLSGIAGVVGGVFMVLAARFRLLWLLIVGSVPLGVCFAQANSLRFTATEFAPPGFESKALSLVVTGAVISSAVGPEVGRHTLHALDPPYTATYCFVTGLCLMYSLLMASVEFQRLPSLAAEKAYHSAGGSSGSDIGGSGDEKAAGAEHACRGRNNCCKFINEVASAPANFHFQDGAASVPVPEALPSSEQQSTVHSPVVTGAPAEVVGGFSIGRSEVAVVIISTSQSFKESGDAVPGFSGRQPNDSDALGSGLRSDDCDCDLTADVVRRNSKSGDSTTGGTRGALTETPLHSLLLSWQYVVPVLTASLSYCGMAGMMTASPLAIRDSNYDFDKTTQVIQVHIISMFLPSLLTGHVIGLISARWTMTLGSVLLMCGTAIFFGGKQLSVFFGGNSVVGLGWNWAYVGASALVTGTYQPDTKFVAQGVMDTAVLFGTGLSVVLAGTLYSRLGWVMYTAVFMGCSGLMVAMDSLLILVLHRRTRPPLEKLHDREDCGT